ncbi:MAG TPA: methyltransferase [Polyangia bacterium]|nr:methyltransferase [Polyangia bacterium]
MVAAVGLLAAGEGCARRRVGPNDAYRDPRVSAEQWNRLFEGDEREAYRRRTHIVRLLDLRPGMDVVDVGAGTGVFTVLLGDAVGPTGRVYAEEVTDKFVRFIADRAARERRANVVSVAGTETGVGLPPGSVDVAFLCDVYHHFAQPASMLASIAVALRPGGGLFLVDFRRDAGRSPPWILEHVRATEAQVVREFEQAGFVSVMRDDSLSDNYVRRFRLAPEAAGQRR